MKSVVFGALESPQCSNMFRKKGIFKPAQTRLIVEPPVEFLM